MNHLLHPKIVFFEHLPHRFLQSQQHPVEQLIISSEKTSHKRVSYILRTKESGLLICIVAIIASERIRVQTAFSHGVLFLTYFVFILILKFSASETFFV